MRALEQLGAFLRKNLREPAGPKSYDKWSGTRGVARPANNTPANGVPRSAASAVHPP